MNNITSQGELERFEMNSECIEKPMRHMLGSMRMFFISEHSAVGWDYSFEGEQWNCRHIHKDMNLHAYAHIQTDAQDAWPTVGF